MDQKKMKFRAAVTLVLPLLGGVGCGTIRGVAPQFHDSPGKIALVSPPLAPAALPDEELRKRLEFAPLPGTLQAVGTVSSDPLVIYYPSLRLKTEDEVVKTPAKGKGDVTGATNTFQAANSAFLAIVDLKNESAQEAASGRLAADFLYRAFKRKGGQSTWKINVIDRENAFARMKGEQRVVKRDEMVVSDSDYYITNSKELQFATFWVSGAVTTFSLENKELQFDYTFDESSYTRFTDALVRWRQSYADYMDRYRDQYLPSYQAYQKEFSRRGDELAANYRDYQARYQSYQSAYQTDYSKRYSEYVAKLKQIALISNIVFLPAHLALEVVTFGDADTWTKAVPYSKIPLFAEQEEPSLGVAQDAFPMLDLSTVIPPRYDLVTVMTLFRAKDQIPPPVSRMATVCNVGITLRLVEGKTSDIVWIGNGTVRSTDLQVAMQEVCDKLVDQIMNDVRFLGAE